MPEFRMPSLGADMAAGTLVAWRKRPGESVRRGEIVAEVETEKGVIEVEVFEDGVIERLVVQPGEKVPVGTVLAWLGSGETAQPEPSVVTPVPSVAALQSQPAEVGAKAAAFATSTKLASPSARRLARELGVRLDDVVGSGEHGAIVRADILRAQRPEVASAGASVGRTKVSPLARKTAATLTVSLDEVRGTGVDGSIVQRDVLRAREANLTAQTVSAPQAPATLDAAERKRLAFRHAIAAAMERSKREIPHYYLSTTLDFSAAQALIEDYNRDRKPRERLVASLLFARAVAVGLAKVPELNAHWTGSDAPPLSAIHVGMAISVRGGGLVAPALFDVGTKRLDELAPALFDLVERTRSGSLRSSELSAPTITVTSLGERGVDALLPIIFPPQVAIVGFGKVAVRPWVVNGAVVARPVVTVSLGADHRVSDGHRGGLFLASVQDALEHPDKL